MEKGENLKTKQVLETLDILKLDEYVEEVLNRQILNFSNDLKLMQEQSQIMKKRLTDSEISYLRYYTGINHDKINAILRKNWHYAKNFSELTKDLSAKYNYFAQKIKEPFTKALSMDYNFTVYRRVIIDTFHPYNINSLNDLLFLKGKYFYELGFMSTSFNKFKVLDNYFNGGPIKLTIVIPKECSEGIPLLDGELTYHEELTEFLLDSDSLFKIVDVNLEKTEANLLMVYIPRKVISKVKSNFLRK